MDTPAPGCDIGIIGLAVMGENLALNFAAHGFRVAVHDRDAAAAEGFVRGRGGEFVARGAIRAAASPAELAALLAPPRRVMLMVRAGAAVDSLMESLAPALAAGDVIIDGGNSHYRDTARRVALAESRGLLFLGAGVSGGGEGARTGPAIMPGGSPAAWPLVKPLFQAIAARAPDGTPCCAWLGPGGAGHFAKTVHNGIEYADMQCIAEAYQLLRDGLGLDAAALSAVFAEWNRGDLDSYLVAVTRDILARRDDDGRPLVDAILDAAGQKGTGKWSAAAALDQGEPATLMAEAVFARFLSAAPAERAAAAAVLAGPSLRFPDSGTPAARAALSEDIRQALFAARLVSYAQGFRLLRAASDDFGWGLPLAGIARLWRGGCIIRSAFLDRIADAYTRNPALTNLLLDPFFTARLAACQDGWRRTCSRAALAGIPAPALASALAYYDGCRAVRLPANLIQAQRDYFGGHQYERVDAPRGRFFHTDWTGEGGAAATEYQG